MLLSKDFSYLLDGELAGELRESDWLERKASHLDRESLSLGALASCCTTSSKEVEGFFLLPPTPAPPILFRLFSPAGDVFGIALVVAGVVEEFPAGDSPCLLLTCRSQELRAWKDLGHCKYFQGWPLFCIFYNHLPAMAICFKTSLLRANMLELV